MKLLSMAGEDYYLSQMAKSSIGDSHQLVMALNLLIMNITQNNIGVISGLKMMAC